jgi:Tol biopolymer transport system component/tRNA A-37 threonylcarbamoyl transferase component Bud32
MPETPDHLPGSLPASVAAALAERYRIERELGQGGMATVYLAEDVRHHRKVAVKVLRPELAAVLGSERFLREITITAGLEHPHILPLLDSGAIPGDANTPPTLYYVMPLVEGESLRDRLTREKQLPLDEALTFAREVADALSYAHARGVIHRDIKPENILLSGGHARVADFGIARALTASGGERLTATGMTVGTPHYMSPEQAAGNDDLDGRSDLYALGCVLYEMLAGQPPFTGPTVQSLVSQHLTAAPMPITQIRPAVPADVAAALERALAKTPADRFNPTAQFAEALGHRGTGGQAAVPQRKAWLVPVLAAAVVVLIAVAGFSLLRGTNHPLTIGTTTQVTREPGLEVDPALSPDGQFVAYAAGPPDRMQIFVQQVGGGRVLQLTTDTSTNHRWPRWSPDGERIAFQSPEGIATVPALGGQERSLLRLPRDSTAWNFAVGAPAGFTWSPDGSRIAYATSWSGLSSPGITIVPVEGGNPTKLTGVPAPHSPAWSPDGSRIAVASDNPEFVFGTTYFGNEGPSSIWIVPLDGSPPTPIVSDGAFNESPQWSPDGGRLFWISSAGGGRDIYYADIGRDGRLKGTPRRLTSGTGAQSFTLSGDGRHLAYTALRTHSNIWSLPVPRSGSVTAAGARPLTTGDQLIENVSVSPDGQWLTFASDRTGDAEIYRMPAAGGDMIQLTNQPGGDYQPAWSADGKRIVFHSLRGGDRDIYTMAADGSDVRQVAGGPGHQLDASWSRDGSRISFQLINPSDSTSQIVVAPLDGGAERKYPIPADFAFWSPTRDLVALHMPTGLGVLDPADGNVRIVAPGTPRWGQPLYAAWAPDGRTIYYVAESATGSSIHAVPLQGGPSRLLVDFDDPTRQHTRYGFATDGKTFYFTVGSHESDVWVMELK